MHELLVPGQKKGYKRHLGDSWGHLHIDSYDTNAPVLKC